MRKLCFTLCLLLSLFVSARAIAIQPAIPIAQDKTFRLTVDPTIATDFASLNRLDLSVDFAHRLGYGFEWGVSLNGGAASPQLLFVQSANGILGVTLMGRYLGSITNVFHIGLQLELLYTHNFSQVTKAGATGARFSIPFVAYFEKAVGVYLMPGLQFEGAIVDTRNSTASTFGQSLGASLAFGLALFTPGPGVFLAARPFWVDVRVPGGVSADFALGLIFDF